MSQQLAKVLLGFGCRNGFHAFILDKTNISSKNGIETSSGPQVRPTLGKRLVKSPKVYVRDSGLLHALLGLGTHDALLAHPVVGNSWEGFAIETLLNAAPRDAQFGFYRSSNGAEIDLVIDAPGQGLMAIEVKRGVTAKPRRGFYSACEDLKPVHKFLVHGGADGEAYPVGDGVMALSLRGLA